MSTGKLSGASISWSAWAGVPLLALLGQASAQAAPAIPSLPNPGFEQDAAGVASPAGWTSTGTTGADFTEFGGHSGDFRLSHWSGAAQLWQAQ